MHVLFHDDGKSIGADRRVRAEQKIQNKTEEYVLTQLLVQNKYDFIAEAGDGDTPPAAAWVHELVRAL